MKNRRFLSLFLILALFVSSMPFAMASGTFEVDARAALLVDEGTGEILYEKNCHEHNYPASITKVMTALLTLEAVDAGLLTLDQEVTASEGAFDNLAADGSTANIKPGETMSVENLLNCMLIVSANEATHILAEAVSGSVENFVVKMNERAEQLGCKDTYFANPSGLHNDRHYSSAWDIYLITREAMKHETFTEICSRKAYTVPETNLSKARELHSTNYLISTWRTGWPGYYYADARGIKTGSTPEAGYCLVASAVRGSRTLISVVLGAERVKLENGTNETRSFTETIRLFDHGFDDFKRMTLLDTEEFICEVPVELSSEANYVVVHPAEEIERMVPADLTLEALTRTVNLHSETVDAPIAAGDELGTITIGYEGVEYGTVPLLALNDVSASWLLTKQREVTEFLAKPWVKLAAIGAAALIVGLVVLRAVSVSRSKRYSRTRGGYSYSGYRGRRKR
ncbi:MAG: D-alanyl-D-alanine carboxypeptidase [Ruminococcaceae bacterium]|nr:D-alanyl-D-alanine carboxypeptidase [Oscillospiraceae bacterium]